MQAYRAADYLGALTSLARGLKTVQSRSQRARAHLYIGLIQHRFGQEGDARKSLQEAVRLRPAIELPDDAPAEVRAIVDAARPKKKRKKKRRAQGPPSGGADAPPLPTLEPIGDSYRPRTSTRSARPAPPRFVVHPTPARDSIEAGGALLWLGTGISVGFAAVGAGFTTVSFFQSRASDRAEFADMALHHHDNAVRNRNIGLAVLGVSAVSALMGAVGYMLD